MANSTIELSLMDAEEKQQLEYIWNLIPAEDRQGMTQADVLMVLDLMDDYLVSQGLLQEEDNTDEVTYLEGEIDIPLDNHIARVYNPDMESHIRTIFWTKFCCLLEISGGFHFSSDSVCA